jgi:hypothetical protein
MSLRLQASPLVLELQNIGLPSQHEFARSGSPVVLEAQNSAFAMLK